MRTTIRRVDQARLDLGATLLDTVGRTSTSAVVATRCLLAADLLVRCGATPASRTSPSVDDHALVVRALKLLGEVSDAVLDDDDVLEAMHHALLAQAAAG